MPAHVVIDGNNLLHAMRAHAPIPLVGRETMVKVIERWARQGDDRVTLVLDGRPPAGAMAKQMASSRIDVRFSAGKTADDVIVDIIHRAAAPTNLRVVSADTAIKYEAKLRGCAAVSSLDFISELFPPGGGTKAAGALPGNEKPQQVGSDEAEELERRIGDLGDELFDGLDWP